MFSFGDTSIKSNAKPALARKGKSSRAIHLDSGFIEIEIESNTEGCSIFDPKYCEDGITMSILVRLLGQLKGSTDASAAYLYSSGPPAGKGFSISLKCSDSECTQTLISFHVSNGNSFWRADATVNMSQLIGQWTTFGLSWKAEYGAWGLIDGIIVGKFTFAYNYSIL